MPIVATIFIVTNASQTPGPLQAIFESSCNPKIYAKKLWFNQWKAAKVAEELKHFPKNPRTLPLFVCLHAKNDPLFILKCYILEVTH